MNENAETKTNAFSLDDLNSNFVPKDTYSDEVSRRDRKINELADENKRLREESVMNTAKFDNLSEQFNEFKQRMDNDSFNQQQRSFELTEDEAEALDGAESGVKKLIQRSLLDRDKQIEKLNSQIEELKSASGNSDLSEVDKRMRSFDDVLQRQARATLGIDRYAKDEQFIEWAKNEKFSKLSNRSLYEVFTDNSSIKPGDDHYGAALDQTVGIISLYNSSQKQDVSATPRTTPTSEAYKPTPQEQKVMDKIDKLSQQRRAKISSGDIKGAEDLKDKITELTAELPSQDEGT